MRASAERPGGDPHDESRARIELASARIEHEWRERSGAITRARDLAGLEARLKSLEELEAARAEYGDAARALLAQAAAMSGQRGAVAGLSSRSRRVTNARSRRVSAICSSTSSSSAQNTAGGVRARARTACRTMRFLIVSEAAGAICRVRRGPAPDGVVALSSVVHGERAVTREPLEARSAKPRIAESFEAGARQASRTTGFRRRTPGRRALPRGVFR